VAAATAPAWNALTPAQQTALKPLAANWGSLSAAQKRKWLEVSRNFPELPRAGQVKLHSRMAEWVALSSQQRTQARLNYAEAGQLAPDQKQAKWKAYQALSPDEKQRLAARAEPKPGAAVAIKPVAPNKLAAVPPQQGSGSHAKSDEKQGRASAPSPKIAAAPHQVNSNTLLPQQMDGNALLPQHIPVSAPVQQH
jgi:hypothetical protein